MPVLEDDRQAEKSSDGFDDIARNYYDDAFNDIVKNSLTDKKQDGNDPDNINPDKVADAEERAADTGSTNGRLSPQQASEQQALSNRINFTGNDSVDAEASGGSAFSRKKAGIGIGILMVLSGGGIGLFGILAQPLQLMQMSNFLQNTHFSSGENAGDGRMTKIGRYLRYGGDERTRMGVLGNKYANRLETRLNKSGLKSTYDGPNSTFSGYDIDTENVKNSKTLGDLEGKSPEQIKEALRKRFDLDAASINIDADTGKIRINPEGTLGERRMLRAALEEAGFSKVGAAMRARIMGKRAGTTWSPIKKIDRKIIAKVDELFATWKAGREAGISNGEGLELDATAKDTVDEDGNGTPDQPNADAADAAEGVDNIKEPDTPNAKPDTPAVEVEIVKSKLLAKAGITSAIIGVLCTAKALADNYDEIKHNNIVLPLMRLGTEGLAVGNQIITGQNLDSKQIDYMTKLLYDPETKTSWTSAKSVQYEMGKNMAGPDINPEAKVSSDSNVFSAVLDEIPLLDEVCGIANTTFGFLVTLSIDVASGPFSALIGTALSAPIGSVFNGFIRWIAGHPIDVTVAGANYGNYINYGARLASNDTAIAGGGRQLTKTEVAELRNEELLNARYEFSNKSLYAKIFDARDYRSVAGRIIMQQAPDPMQNIARVASLAPRSLASLFGSFGNLLGSKAYASEDYDYGFPKYGFSLSEQNSKLVENPLENDKIVADLLEDPGLADTYSKRSIECFNIEITKKNNLWAPVSLGAVPAYNKIPDSCSSNEDNWLRIRTWIQDSQLMGAFGCFEDGADNTCDEFGFSGQENATTPQISAPGLNGYAIPCQGKPSVATRLSGKGGAIDWSNIIDSGSIGTNSDGKDIKVYIRNACVTANAKTIVITGSIHGSENVGQLVAHELLFNATLPQDVRVIAIPEVNGYGVGNFDRQNKNGVDLNRNFPYRWNEITEDAEDKKTSEYYRGLSAGSEPETISVMNFLKNIGTVNLFLSYHHDLSYATSVGTTNTAIGKAYADIAGLENKNSAGATVVNQHGSMDLWFNNQTKAPTVLVELKSSSYYDTDEKIKTEVAAVLAAYNATQSQ